MPLTYQPSIEDRENHLYKTAQAVKTRLLLLTLEDPIRSRRQVEN